MSTNSPHWHAHPLAKRTLVALLLSWSALPCMVRAGEHERTSRLPPPVRYVQECAACHVAYPAGMLPAASWQRLLNGLDRHYGTNASLEPQDLALVSRWLLANADTRHTVSPSQDRITQAPWFERKHRHIESTTWQLPSVRSAANCAACHTGAEQGRFDEHALRMPAGLSPRQRASWND